MLIYVLRSCPSYQHPTSSAVHLSLPVPHSLDFFSQSHLTDTSYMHLRVWYLIFTQHPPSDNMSVIFSSLLFSHFCCDTNMSLQEIRWSVSHAVRFKVTQQKRPIPGTPWRPFFFFPIGCHKHDRQEVPKRRSLKKKRWQKRKQETWLGSGKLQCFTVSGFF